MFYKVSTDPTAEPVSLSEAKLWMKVDGDDDDALISSLIIAARDYCQQYEGRAYVEQEITAYADNYRRIFYLPVSPVLTVESVEYRDADEAWQTVSSDYYTLRNEFDPAYIEFDLTGLSYTLSLYPNRIRVVFTAGYRYDDNGEWAGSVPDRVKAAMCLLIGHWYEHRIASCEAQLKEIPMGVKSLLSERVWTNAD
jgi:uncharacterized phiE125 gp8 family phage protein